ncbi:MAG: transcriptional repressor [Chloroflexaceae bacterium]|nr:transcriptional repressor [Chloroflexaceae bacterium]NJO04918.1 transcriptional repressor [Chloroflexaceae bacterium]
MEPVDLAPEMWRNRVEEMLISSGQRLTMPRRAILDWIAHADAPFTAETLVDELVDQRNASSRPTVYRTVEWLRSAGWIARVQSDGPEHTYARMLPGHYHHAVCTDCGTTLVVPGCEAINSLTTLLQQQGFEVQGHILELFGICERCRTTATPATEATNAMLTS